MSMTSRFHVLATTLLGSLLCGGVAPALAQSLGDVARQEEARRKGIRQPAKTYTNKDLGDIPLPSTPPPAEEAKPFEGSSAPAAQQDDKSAAKDTTVVKKDQAYWSRRTKDLSAQLDRDQTYAEAMQSRVSALTADFAARSDPAQRDQIGRDRKKALDELDRLKKATQDTKKNIADLQEEARRAGVPPGWLR